MASSSIKGWLPERSVKPIPDIDGSSSANSATEWGQRRFRLRADLRVQEQPGDSGVSCVLHDPVRQEYFLFSPAEYQILQRFRGTFRLIDVMEQLQFSGSARHDTRQVAAFVRRLLSEQLLVEIGGESARMLVAMRRRLTRSRPWTWGSNLLAMRLPGIDPQPVLNWLHGVSLLLFSRIAIFLLSACLLATLFYLVLQWPNVIGKIPSWSWFLRGEHLLWGFAGYLVVKAFHELGHGMACQAYGGKVREMGVLLLFLSPCLYCDASDAWMIPKRWQRVMVSLAGIYVELIAALVCFWLWQQSRDPQWGAWFFTMTLMTSINTVLVNGNPLMRYDGYYALADSLEIPNLGHRSQQESQRVVEHLFFQGVPIAEGGIQWSLVIYAWLSGIYRQLIFLTILGGIFWYLPQIQLQGLRWPLVVSLAALLYGRPLLKNLGSGVAGIKRADKRWPVWGIVIVLAGLLTFMLFLFPVHHRIYGTALVELVPRSIVYAPQTGRWFAAVGEGDSVRPGQTLGHVETTQWTPQRIRLAGEIEQNDQRLRALELQSGGIIDYSAEIELWQQRRQTLQSEFDELERKIETSIIKSSVAGRLFGPLQPGADGPPDLTTPLPYLQESKFGPAHQGCHVDRGEALGVIADPDQRLGRMWVSQFEQEAISVGQLVKVQLDQTTVLEAVVTHVQTDQVRRPESQDSVWMTSYENAGLFSVEFEFKGAAAASVPVGARLKCVLLGPRHSPWQLLRKWIDRVFLR